MITAGTIGKEKLLNTPEKLDIVQNTFMQVTSEYLWVPIAWAFLSNHYHYIAYAMPAAKSMTVLQQRFHSQTSRLLNKIDGTPGRKVWAQHWDKTLTYEVSYYARLNYVHNNPVKHGIVTNPLQYRWCSANWFTQNSDKDLIRKISSYRYDQLHIDDDY